MLKSENYEDICAGCPYRIRFNYNRKIASGVYNTCGVIGEVPADAKCFKKED